MIPTDQTRIISKFQILKKRTIWKNTKNIIKRLSHEEGKPNEIFLVITYYYLEQYKIHIIKRLTIEERNIIQMQNNNDYVTK